ncbi:MAG: carbohydrate binding domain-containing protein [Clostridia bacterium]|nr:carbohydrate binding domain-containing protein [Clostridia bacterium]
MKQILGLCLSVLCMVMTWPCQEIAATEYVQVNNVANPGFEEDFFGTPSEWVMASGDIRVETEDAHSGNRSLRLSGVTIAYQSIYGVVGGTAYTISAYVKVEGGSTLGDVVYCKAECNTGYEDNLYSGNFSTAATGDWQLLSITFTPPSDVTAFTLLLRTRKGTALWDDVSVMGQFEKAYDVTNPKPEGKPATLSPMDGPELLNNNGFEKGLNQEFWHTSSTFLTGGYVSVSNMVRPGATDTKTIRIATNTGNRPHIYTSPGVAVQENTQYQLSFWYRTTCKQLSVKLEYSNGSSFGYAETKLPYAERTYGNGWTQYAVVITTPKGATTVSILPRLYGTGEAWIDDISMYKIAQPRLLLETDRVFYYSDRTEPCVATVSFNTAHYSDMASYDVKLQISDGNTIVYTSEKRSAAEKMTFTFASSVLQALGKDYKVEACLSWKSTGKEVQRQTETVSRWHRPRRLSEDGKFLDGGKEFTPVIAYDVPEALFGEMKKAGINTVRIGLSDAESTLKTLEAAKEAGLKVLACAYANMRPTAHGDNIGLYRKTIRAISGHEALFAYVLLDEPQANLHPLEDMLYASYRLVRENDPYTPVLLVEAPALYAAYANTSKYCDILAVDPYTSTRVDVLDYTEEHIGKAFAATEYKMPVVSLFRTYGSTDNFPTIDELRYQVYNAMFHGLMGYGYYNVEKAYNGTTNLTDTDLWQKMQTAYETEYIDATAAFLEGKYPIYLEMKNETVHAKSYVKDGKIYLIALNRTAAEQSVTILLSSGDESLSVEDFTAKAIGGKTDTVSGSGKLTYTVPAMGAVRFEITPKNDMDFSQLSAEQYVDLNGFGWAREQIEDVCREGYMEGKTYQSFAPGATLTEEEGAALLQKTTGKAVSMINSGVTLTRTRWTAFCTEVVNRACKNNPAKEAAVIDITEKIRLAAEYGGAETVTKAAAAFTADRLLKWKDADWRLIEPLSVTFSANGREIDALPAGKTELSVSAKVQRAMRGGMDNAVVLVGIYKEKELLSIHILPVPETNGEYNTVQTQIPVQKGETVKVFLRSRSSPLLPGDWEAIIK